ncbi:GntR family transcriptional regulator [Saccharothrix obliqua]|uniref:GntR family transcriptional regulator n=1 Tax=Saccharothrix obliqua TaxID=2861747 RepID=UPI001C5E31D4|nr:GntR family transcriptional regulator [Saccharothrix obliqua]MBW4718038.1 GntR family transcriptional regulator [Saccharothrix obliqua]
MRFAAPLTVPVVLDRRTGVPLPRQVAAGLRAAMSAGRLPPGGRLPSTRTLAATLGVSRGVVEAAYDLLAARGHVRAAAGSGTYVAGTPAPPPRPAAGAGPVDLRPGLLCLESFPHAAWRAAWRHAAGAPPPTTAEPHGAAELRHALATHLVAVHGCRLDGRTVLVTTGREAGLRLAPDVAGDFAALFGPALRVGYAVVAQPPDHLPEQPPHVAQLAVARLLDDGTVARTMRRRVRVLTRKKSIVDEVLRGVPLRHLELGTVEVAGRVIGYGHLPDPRLRAALAATTPRGRAPGGG